MSAEMPPDAGSGSWTPGNVHSTPDERIPSFDTKSELCYFTEDRCTGVHLGSLLELSQHYWSCRAISVRTAVSPSTRRGGGAPGTELAVTGISCVNR
jgi:hypothetical protein